MQFTIFKTKSTRISVCIGHGGKNAGFSQTALFSIIREDYSEGQIDFADILLSIK